MTHEVATGIFRSKQGKLILQLRDNVSNIKRPGYVGFFGGHVEPEETPEQAFVREIQEELGITLTSFQLLVKEEYIDDEGDLIKIYVYTSEDLDITTLDCQEGNLLLVDMNVNLDYLKIGEDAKKFIELYRRGVDS